MLFEEVSNFFNQIEQEPSRIEMTKLLASLFSQATAEEGKILAYLSLGTLRAPYKGVQFNFADRNFIVVLSKILGIPTMEVKQLAQKYGDIGLVLEREGFYKIGEPLSLIEVYQRLCEFEQISGIGSQEEKIEYMVQFLKSVDLISAKYIIRIVLGALRLGFSAMTLIDALSWMCVGDKSLHKDIEHAYNIRADIGLITHALIEGGFETLTHMQIEVGIPIRPAAAERLPSAQAIIDKLGICVAQPKLDGFRLQIHIDNTGNKSSIHFFSRNLIDMSNMFPDLVKELKQLPISTGIFEGEAIAIDPYTGNFVPFQETVKRKRKHGIEQAAIELPLKIFLFDILYLNGESLLHMAHNQRRMQLLRLLAHVQASVISVIEEEKIEDVHQLEAYLMKNIAEGLEGLVVKRINAHYQPGKRNFNWIKLKRGQIGKLEDSVDVVILGYYLGKGKRVSFGIGAFLVGIFNKKSDYFETIAKVGTGLKDIDWIELRKKCDELTISKQPKNVECATELFPDVWITPHIVCSVRADEITLSPMHTAGKTTNRLGYALRFPRFIGYRVDKQADQATTLGEIERLYQDQFVKK